MVLLAAASAAPQAAESQLLDLDGTIVIMLGIFLLLLAVLWLFLWRPYLRVRDERVARIDGARALAAELEAQATSRLAQVESALAEARRAGDAETAKLRLDAQTREQQLVAEAQAAARTMLAEARAKLAETMTAEQVALAQQTESLARAIAEKALGRSMAS
jgi:F-type H+-transporting ATPase subunit b